MKIFRHVSKKLMVISGRVMIGCLLAVVSCTTTDSSMQEPLNQFELFYDQPAMNWNEALPLGNGRLGAMVFGGVSEEHIQFNEETLWTGEPRSYNHPGAANYLGDIQRLLFEGKQLEAQELAMEHFMSVPLRQKAYQPFGDLYLSFEDHDQFTDYRRSLNLNEALHQVSYKIGTVSYTREALISQEDQVLALKLNADQKGALSFEMWLDAIHEDKAVVTDGNSQQLTVKVKDGALFGDAVLRVITDGELSNEGGKISVRNSRQAVIYLTAATNYKRYDDVSNDPKKIVDSIYETLGEKSYEKIKADHIADYQWLFNRFDLSFGDNEKTKLPINQRLESFGDTLGDPQLIALYVQYGRYLMLASSREGTYPANLQGIWNDKLAPSWDSKYTTNINTEMNYWLSEVGNISETHEALFKMIEEISIVGTSTAKEHYDSRGWVHHHNTDIWRGTAPINNSNHGIFLGGGGWLAHHFWEHYLYTQNLMFLRDRAYPIMKQSAIFYLDALIEDPKTGWLVSSPSNSPETGGLVYGPSMDHQIIRSLFKACIESARILNTDFELIDQLSDTLKKIAPDQIGQYGQLQEWVEDKDDTTNHHRHVSHLWGVHPGREITWSESPEMMEAAKRSLMFRGDEATGWSLAWKINFWARFLDGDHAYELIKLLFRPVATQGENFRGGGSYPNLFDAHPPFQIDGNFGAAAGILEMLMQSHLSTIDLLPALPTALPKGSLSGIRARGGFELSFSWENGELSSLEVISLAGKDCTIQYGGQKLSFATEIGGYYQIDNELKLIPK